MAWVYFQNQAAWDTYHDAACLARGIPRPGYRADDDAVMLANQWTDAWVDPIQFKAQGNVTSWVARVPDEDVVTYNLGGFVVPDSAVVLNADGTVSVTIGTKTYVAEPTTMTWRKAKPATWTDPKTGTVYQVT